MPADPPATARHAPELLAQGKPMRGLLTVGGVSGPLGSALEATARRDHRAFLAVPPGPLGSYPPQPLVPGASVGAGYSVGDIAVGAIGTVTYIGREPGLRLRPPVRLRRQAGAAAAGRVTSTR